MKARFGVKRGNTKTAQSDQGNLRKLYQISFVHVFCNFTQHLVILIKMIFIENIHIFSLRKSN